MLNRKLCWLAAALLIPAVASFRLWQTSSYFTIEPYQFVVFVIAVVVASYFSGFVRDTATIMASLLFGLMAAELIALANDRHDQLVESPDFYASIPNLGWGAARADTYHSVHLNADGKAVFDVTYTIDDNLLRHSNSANTGPLVAFFGDSYTFGMGLNDAETLPQAFTDLDNDKTRVINFGYPAYGPQQFLRAIETKMYDGLLRPDVKLFVYQTSAWHAERSNCAAAYVVRAPRYELRGKDLVYEGSCYAGFRLKVQEFFWKSAAYRRFVEPNLPKINSAAIELYLAEVAKAVELARKQYGAPTVVLYISAGDAYLKPTGFTDTEIVDRMRKAGVDVLRADLKASDLPAGVAMSIPGDGHPTGAANRARALLLRTYLKEQFPSLLAQVKTDEQ